MNKPMRSFVAVATTLSIATAMTVVPSSIGVGWTQAAAQQQSGAYKAQVYGSDGRSRDWLANIFDIPGGTVVQTLELRIPLGSLIQPGAGSEVPDAQFPASETYRISVGTAMGPRFVTNAIGYGSRTPGFEVLRLQFDEPVTVVQGQTLQVRGPETIRMSGGGYPVGALATVQSPQMGAMVRGFVDGAPRDGSVTVELRNRSNGEMRTTRTNSGTYEFLDVPAGSYDVRLSDAPVNYRVTSPNPILVDVPRGESGVSAPNFTLTRNTGAIPVSVSGLAGGEKPTVTITGPSGQVWSGQAGNGSFVLPDQVAGTYTVSVAGGPSDHTLTSDASQTVKINDDGSVTGSASFTYEQNKGVIPLAVSGLAGSNQVTVMVKDAAGRTVWSEKRGNGSVEVPNLTAGSYTVSIAGGPSDHTLTSGASQTVKINDDGSVTGSASFTYEQNTATVNGSVSGLSGGQQVTVRVTNAGGTEVLKREQGNEGFSVANQPAGSYTVTVTGLPAGYEFTSTGGGTQQVTIDASGRADRRADFTVQAKDGTVSGSVAGEDGTPVAGVKVELVGKDGKSVPVKVNADGSLERVTVRPGEYTVKVTAPAGFDKPGEKSITVKPGGKVTIDPIKVVAKDGTVSGSVTGEDGTPVSGVKVELVGKDGKSVPVKVNADGSLEPVTVRPGEYTVKVTPPAGYNKPADTKITIEPGDAERLPEIKLQPTPTTAKSTTAKPTPTTAKPTPTPTTAKPTTAKPTPTTAKPTTAKPTPTTPKPTPKPPTTTEPPVPANGYIWVQVRDQHGGPVTGARVVVRDVQTNRAVTTLAVDYAVEIELPAGPYEFELHASDQYVMAESRTVTLEAGQTVTTTLLAWRRQEERPVPQVTWDRVEMNPGDITLTSPSGTNDAADSVTFQIGGMAKVGPDDTHEVLPPEASWVEVEPDGRIVATPSSDVEPGEYEVEILDSDGHRHTATILIAPQTRMKDIYTLSATPVEVPAGSSRKSATPRASANEGGLIYPDRAVPAGTTFNVQFAGASVDKHGRVLYTPPVDAKPGPVRIPVEAVFPDGSVGRFEVVFTVGEPLMAHRYPLAYEQGISVVPGDTSTVFLAANSKAPEGTAFALRAGADLNRWMVTVDKASGAVRATAPETNGAPLTVPVVAFFPDGSTQEISAALAVADRAAQAANHSPSYAPVSATRGATVTLPLEGTIPEETTFRLEDPQAKGVSIDRATGQLTVQVPDEAPLDTTLPIGVRANFQDKSSVAITAQVKVVGQAALFTPDFQPAQVTSGDTESIVPSLNVPDGTTFKVPDTFKRKGWTAKVDPVTGKLTVTTTADVPDDEEVMIPIEVTYPDGSTQIVSVPVTASRPLTAEPDTTSSGSSTTDWIIVVLGVLAALGATGYAAWLNQDEIRRFLAQFGIRI